MNSPGVSAFARLDVKPVVCSRCKSTSRIGRGFCLGCLLSHGLDAQVDNGETLQDVLDEIDVRDTDWRLGNYQILEEIGRGGMGVIYRARQRHSRRIVALKRLLAYHADSLETLERFRREAEAAASLDHPNILPIYEVGESEEGLPFFSMKFAGGGSLLDAGPALRNEPRRCVALIAKVARAVHYAHLHGVLHRDLKPGNITLDGHGEPLVTDFGLAKWLDTKTNLTRTLTVFGTPGYIAPEQARGPAANLTPAADVYSLGAILFDLFTGCPPFLGEHALAVVQQAAERPAPKLRSLAPSLDRDLETICARCLERDSQARYRSAGDLAEDLERWLDGRPILARPLLPPARIWRWSKRNPKLAAAGAVWLSSAIALASFFLFSQSSSQPSVRGAFDKSIAVLPFEDLSEKQNPYFTEGMHDEILNDLANVADLKVISRTSVMPYTPSPQRDLRKIAGDLGVAYVMEGSIQQMPDRVRVHARLSDGRTNTQVWDGEYERVPKDSFTIQREIAEKIVVELNAKLSPAEKRAIGQQPTADLVAFDMYAHARSLIDRALLNEPRRENLFEAVRLLEEAVKRDPSFPLAYYELAHAHDQIYWTGFDLTPHRLALADSAIQSLRRLRPDSGETHLAQAKHSYWGYLDYDRARQELAAAKDKLPNNPLIFLFTGYIDRRQGRLEESIENLKRAADLDPRNPTIPSQIGLSHEFLRQYPQMATMFDRALMLAPTSIRAKLGRARVDLDQRADTRPLHNVIENLIARDPTNAAMIADDWFDLALLERDPDAATRAIAAMGGSEYAIEGIAFPRGWCLGCVAQLRGDVIAARFAFLEARNDLQKWIREEPDNGRRWCVLGLVDAQLGNSAEAVREGRRAVELLPHNKEALDGEICVQYLAAIYARVGDKDAALDQLARAANLPGYLNYGDLRLNPMWDPLRGDLRFEQIVASVAPK